MQLLIHQFFNIVLITIQNILCYRLKSSVLKTHQSFFQVNLILKVKVYFIFVIHLFYQSNKQKRKLLYKCKCLQVIYMHKILLIVMFLHHQHIVLLNQFYLIQIGYQLHFKLNLFFNSHFLYNIFIIIFSLKIQDLLLL